MNEEFWQERWHNNQIAFHNADAHPLLVRNILAMDVRPGARVFVPLCGKSNDLLWFARNGYTVVGAELSRIAVEQFFQELGDVPQITPAGSLNRYEIDGICILQGSIFDLTPEILGAVDLVYDRAALVALPKEMRDRYAPHMVALTAKAPQLLICYEYDQTCIDGPPFSVTESEVRRLYGAAFALHLLERAVVEGGLKGTCPASEAVWDLQ